jgi:hypothetical protein
VDYTLATQMCKLCLEDETVVGELRESHIIPAFMLRRSKDKQGKTVIFEGLKNGRVGQFDWKEKMLCSACEHRMKMYEDFMKELFFLHRKNKILANEKDLVVFRGSNDYLALALLSIYWRATQSKLEEFQWVVAPSYVSSDLRMFLLTETLPINWPRLIRIEIVQVVDNVGKIVPIVATPFHRKYSDKFEFVFAFAGYVVTFTMPPPERTALKKGRFLLRLASDVVRIRKTNFGDIPEFAVYLPYMRDAGTQNKSPQ